jgi:hypothetical protein
VQVQVQGAAANRFCSVLKRVAPWFALLAWAVVGDAQQPVAVRFHHFHLQVDDPAPAMNALAARVDGTRVLLPGLGVGVRSGSEYVLFDRADGEQPVATSASQRYEHAVAWLRSTGLTVKPDAWSAAAFAPHLTGGIIDHVAFAADDLDGAVALLLAARGTVERRSDQAAMFRSADGHRIEIVRDTDRPDAFWCPMHLDVRAPSPSTCPICGMELVPIPPPRLGEYRLDVTMLGSRKVTGLRLRVSDPDGQPVRQFATVHERPFHLFIVNRSLEYFAHVHPEPSASDAASFELRHELPPGEYMLLADFLPYGGTSQMVQRAFVTPGYKGPIFSAAPPLAPGPPSQVVDGTRVTLERVELAAGKDRPLRFSLSDAATGAPVADLEPYLGAAAHLLIVKGDLTDAIHAHPEPTAAISFAPIMPAPGLYKMWLQFQRKGRVSTVAFVVAVH